jgi:hypothetical protein
MVRTFSGYRDFSYTENCDGVNHLYYKDQQTQKVVQITCNSSFIKNYFNDTMVIFKKFN